MEGGDKTCRPSAEEVLQNCLSDIRAMRVVQEARWSPPLVAASPSPSLLLRLPVQRLEQRQSGSEERAGEEGGGGEMRGSGEEELRRDYEGREVLSVLGMLQWESQAYVRAC